ncbi:MAG TPA: hypothetical protein VHA33_00350 [Candidatus Angelobacter sp.]|jgi:hypothetical protein|nr:hypothetical protein [Candidatus Angelobacter sp.]
MIRFVLLLAVCCPLLAQNSGPQPQWSVNLHDSYGFQSFERANNATWLRQQGLVFVTPGWLAVYQVNQRLSPLPLGQRGPNGGAGNFFLDLKILDAHDGHILKSMRFPTSGAFSEVLAARNGNLIVRTGDILYLITPDSKIIASRPLPLERKAPFESWKVDVPPSHAEIALVHQQLFAHPVVLGDGTVASTGKSDVEVEILDPDTLKVLSQFKVSNYLTHWSMGDHFLVGNHASQAYHAEEYGILDFDGQWKNLKATFSGKAHCSPVMDALDQELIAAYSCNGVVVLSKSGDPVFSTKVKSDEVPVSVVSSGNYLAVEFVAMPRFQDTKLRPLRLDSFDVKRGAGLISIPLTKTMIYCDISRAGLAAVLEGETLRMYALGK